MNSVLMLQQMHYFCLFICFCFFVVFFTFDSQVTNILHISTFSKPHYLTYQTQYLQTSKYSLSGVSVESLLSSRINSINKLSMRNKHQYFLKTLHEDCVVLNISGGEFQGAGNGNKQQPSLHCSQVDNICYCMIT